MDGLIYVYESVRRLSRWHSETSIPKSLFAVIVLLSLLAYPVDRYEIRTSWASEQQPSSPDFSLTPEHAFQGVMQNIPVLSNITVSSENGFSGTVTFSQPVTQSWIIATLNGYGVTIAPNNPGIAILNVTAVGPIPFNAPNCSTFCPGNVSLSASTESSTQTATISLFAYGPNFEFYSSQTVPIIQGKTGTVNLTLFGAIYDGPVSLTATAGPGGPRVTINPSKLELNHTSRQQLIVTIDTSGLQLGDYNVTITATELASPYVYHQVKLDVFVWTGPQSPPKAGSFSLDLGSIVSFVALAMFASFLVVTALLDRKARKQDRVSTSS